MSKTTPAGPGRAITLAVFGVLVLAALAVFLQQTVFKSVPVHGKKKAPDVTFYLEDGSEATLADYQGRVVLLNFWASWCPPCIEEMPDLERLHRLMATETDFVIVGASQDTTWAELERAADRFGVTFTVLHDPKGQGALAFGTNKLPETYLLDREGRIVQKWIGYQPWSTPAFVKRFKDVVAADQTGTQTSRAPGS